MLKKRQRVKLYKMPWNTAYKYSELETIHRENK